MLARRPVGELQEIPEVEPPWPIKKGLDSASDLDRDAGDAEAPDSEESEAGAETVEELDT